MGESQIVDLDVLVLDDGRAVQELNDKLQFILQDVMKRSDVNKAREVTLSVMVTSDFDPATDDVMPTLEWRCKYTVPGNKGTKSRAFMRDGKLKIRSKAHKEQPGLFQEKNVVNLEK